MVYQAKQLEKMYDTGGAAVHALRGVDLTIERGEFVAIMGASGSGKSTLLHLLGGLDQPTSGELYFDGKRVDQHSETAWAKLRRKKIGYIFQAFHLLPNMSVADNIKMPALLNGVSADDAHQRQNILLERLGIAGTGDKYPSQLSGGQQQRVAIARALINQPAVLLADEPTGNLDSKSSKEVMRLLLQSHQLGQTIVLVTHDHRIGSIADRIVRVQDGQIAQNHAFEPQPVVLLR